MSAASDASSDSSDPHSIHVVGIGRTGAVYVEALLRTGEIEDQLMHPDARFAGLVVDIGDEDVGIAMDYAAAFVKRLESRGIPTERFHFQAVALPPPSEALASAMAESLAFLTKKAAACAFPEFGSAKPQQPAEAADSHVSRAAAKAIYADAYYGGDRPLETALAAFADHVVASSLPSIVTVCFSLAGGLGGGIAIDLARHLGNAKLGRKVAVVGVGQLPSTGDPAALQASPALYATLNDLDFMLDAEKNEAVVSAWGESYRNPFIGGFLVVNPEQSWQRLTAYTTTGEPQIRHRFKQTVTNRFVADSFMRLVVIDNGLDLIRALRPSGLGDSDKAVSGGARGWTLFDVAKLTHPGVQVLPGESRSKWSSVIGQWIEFTPKYSGLTDGFKTDYAEVFIYSSRNMEQEVMRIAFKKVIAETYLLDASSTLKMYVHEFFDTLTAYANVVLPGVARTDLTAFWASQTAYEALSPSAKLDQHSWVVDTGVKLPAASAALEPMAGTAIWGASCWDLVPAAVLTGKTLPPAARKSAASLTKLAS